MRGERIAAVDREQWHAAHEIGNGGVGVIEWAGF
jgi:hypothetical protein